MRPSQKNLCMDQGVHLNSNGFKGYPLRCPHFAAVAVSPPSWKPPWLVVSVSFWMVPASGPVSHPSHPRVEHRHPQDNGFRFHGRHPDSDAASLEKPGRSLFRSRCFPTTYSRLDLNIQSPWVSNCHRTHWIEGVCILHLRLHVRRRVAISPSVDDRSIEAAIEVSTNTDVSRRVCWDPFARVFKALGDPQGETPETLRKPRRWKRRKDVQ